MALIGSAVSYDGLFGVRGPAYTICARRAALAARDTYDIRHLASRSRGFVAATICAVAKGNPRSCSTTKASERYRSPSSRPRCEPEHQWRALVTKPHRP